MGGLTAPVALLLAVLLTLATLGTLVLVGVLLLAALTPAARRLAGWQRRRTGRWTGRSVPELYTRASGTLVMRVEAVLRDPATWRDLLWLWVFAPVAVVGLLVCWVPFVAPWVADREAGLSRRLLSPTTRAVRQAARLEVARAADAGTDVGSDGHGLVGMRERVAVLGGTLTVGPVAGGGFEVLAELPLVDDLESLPG